MNSLYELETYKRYIIVNGFRHPKTWVPYSPEHPRFLAAAKELKAVEVAMDRSRKRR